LLLRDFAYGAVVFGVVGADVCGGGVVASKNVSIDGSGYSTFDHLHILAAMRLSRHGRRDKCPGNGD
jgi:hypothetical protein